MLTAANTRLGYQNLWKQMTILPSRRAGIEAAAKTIAQNKTRYETVEKATGVAWWVIGLLHMRESSCNFSTFLGNGEPLSRMTTMTPKGLGPWTGADAWERAAAEALHIDGLDQVKVWDIPTALFYCEKYNGFGYVSEGINSPYVWSGTNLYSSGKFTETPAGSTYNPSLRDPQPGCAAMLMQMILLNLIPSLAKEVISMATTTATPATVAPTANPASGVTINKAQNLATHIIVGIGAIIAALGLSQVHSVYDAITNSSLIGGALVSGLAMMISHFNIGGANDNTLDILDKVLVALTPSPQTPAKAVDMMQGTTPASPTHAAS